MKQLATTLVLMLSACNSQQVVDKCSTTTSDLFAQEMVRSQMVSPSSVVILTSSSRPRVADECEHVVHGSFRAINRMGGPVDGTYSGYVQNVNGQWTKNELIVVF